MSNPDDTAPAVPLSPSRTPAEVLGIDGLSCRHVEGRDRTVALGVQSGLHLHRFDGHQEITPTTARPSTMAIEATTPGIGAATWHGLAESAFGRRTTDAVASRFSTLTERG